MNRFTDWENCIVCLTLLYYIIPILQPTRGQAICISLNKIMNLELLYYEGLNKFHKNSFL